jgi:hypothetical protein
MSSLWEHHWVYLHKPRNLWGWKQRGQLGKSAVRCTQLRVEKKNMKMSVMGLNYAHIPNSDVEAWIPVWLYLKISGTWVFIFVGLGFEHRALHLSYTASPFCSGCFGDGLTLCPGWSGLWSSYFTFPAEMISVHHQALIFSLEMGYCKHFFVQVGLDQGYSQSQPSA